MELTAAGSSSSSQHSYGEEPFSSLSGAGGEPGASYFQVKKNTQYTNSILKLKLKSKI